jgi:SAM-dependent methyltransferase
MGRLAQWWEDAVLPVCIDRACGVKGLRPYRRDVCDGLAGTVLEIGFGSGLNLPFLPVDVERLLVVEPHQKGMRLAARRLAACPTPVEVIGRDGAALPLEDATVDAVLCTFTLCTIPDVEHALAEVHRVLRPGGSFHYLEHGRSDVARVRRLQQLWEPAQRRLFGGCHLTRCAPELVEAAGLQHVSRRSWAEFPQFISTLSLGVAVKPV